MVQGYYDLNEAAQFLGVTPEELKQLAQRNQIRSFQDRGTWRFRIQDVQELARQRGAGSDPDLVLGESARPKKGDSPRSGSKGGVPDIFDFPLEFDAVDDKVDVGREILGGGGSKAGSKKGDSKKPESKKGSSKSPQPKTPHQRTPQAGSDSDVRLVSDGGHLDFAVGGPGEHKFTPGSDSDVKLVHDSDVKLSQPPASGLPSTPKVSRPSALGPKSPTPRKSKLQQPTVDSGVRLVPLDSDSDVKIIGAGSDEIPLGASPPKADTDSDIRLERVAQPPRSDEAMMLTEEINLDEELKKQEAALKQKPQAKVKPKSKIRKPSPSETSPFELSDLGLDAPGGKSSASSKASELTDSSDVDLSPKPDSSDFDLTTGSAASPLGVTDSSEDFSLELPDDSDLAVDVSSSLELKGPSSGIALNQPKDEGISLEAGGDDSSLEFELSLDAAATPKPAPQGHAPDSSEFELSLDLDDSSSGNQPALDAAPSDSSEFELTLDDSGNLAPADEDAPQLKAEEKDIFETDFEVPNLEDESGSQVAALETDLDSSDFDLALGDSEIAVEDESGSQVVALDEEEEEDDAAATVAAKRKPAKSKGKAKAKLATDDEEISVDDEDFGELSDLGEEPAAEIEEEEEAADGPVREVVREKLVTTAPWGAMPVVFMLPCVVVLFLVGIMGFEMVQSMAGFKPAGFITKTFTELIEGKKAK